MKKFDYSIIFVVLGLTALGLASFHFLAEIKAKEIDKRCTESALRICETYCGPIIE